MCDPPLPHWRDAQDNPSWWSKPNIRAFSFVYSSHNLSFCVCFTIYTVYYYMHTHMYCFLLCSFSWSLPLFLLSLIPPTFHWFCYQLRASNARYLPRKVEVRGYIDELFFFFFSAFWLVMNEMCDLQVWRPLLCALSKGSIVDMNWSKLQEMAKDGGAWRATVHEVTKNRTQLSNWTATTT